MDCAGWNRLTGALGLVLHPQRTLDRVMITPHLDLKVGLSDTKHFSFLFVFPFGNALPSATNHLINSKLHLSLYFKKIKIVTTILILETKNKENA